MDPLTYYKHLSFELSYANTIIKELESKLKVIPETCPIRGIIKKQIAEAKLLKRDISNDIKHFADTCIRIVWRTPA